MKPNLLASAVLLVIACAPLAVGGDALPPGVPSSPSAAALGGESSLTSAPPAVLLYVSPNGNDANPGTETAPLATLLKARDAVGSNNAAGVKGDVTVLLRGGTYTLDRTLIFGPKFSGTDHRAITFAAYPGEHPVVSGGRRITGWQRQQGDIWSAQLPEVKNGNWYFRDLFVNGRRATRARDPKPNAASRYYSLTGATFDQDRDIFEINLATNQVKQWRNLSDVEVVILGDWDIIRKRIQRVDTNTGMVWLAPSQIRSDFGNYPKAGRSCYFENAPEMLDEPGEWYLDKATGLLSYWPHPSEDMSQAEVIAPVLTTLMDVRGTSTHPVRNLHFRGIEFAYTDWPLPAFGYAGNQTGFYRISKTDAVDTIDPAIEFEYARSGGLQDCQVAHLGGTAVYLGKGCSDDDLEGNAIFDVGANGLMVGQSTATAQPVDVVRNVRIANNHVYACGVEYSGTVGIWVGLAQRITVEHNLVDDLPYGGISVGWDWTTNATICRDNLIAYNLVHDVLKAHFDSGGIYTLGFQPGTKITGNLIHNIRTYDPPAPPFGSGIMLDNGSKGITVTSNIVYEIRGAPIRVNQASKEDQVWCDNTIDLSPEDPQFPKQAAAEAGLEPPYSKSLLLLTHETQ